MISDGLLEHLHTRDTSFVVVSRAPLEKIEKYKARKCWTFPWEEPKGRATDAPSAVPDFSD